MNLTEQINADMKSAMKDGNKLVLETLRSIRAAILEFEKSGVDRELTEDDAISILNKAAKKRKDAIELYRENGRTDAADKEQAELDIISTYLPKQLSADEILATVTAIAEKLGASSQADFGKVMGAAMAELKGSADGKDVQAAVKSVLS